MTEGRRIPHPDIGRITLSVIVIGGLIVLSFWVLKPFLPAILWATTLVLATWPVMLWIEARAGGRRWVAVLTMTLLLLLVLIVPLWLAVGTVVTNLDVIGDLLRQVLSMRVPPPPDWVAGIPLVGSAVVRIWNGFTSSEIRVLAATHLAPYAGTVTRWVASASGSLGNMLIQFVVTAILAAFLYAGGEKAATQVLLFGRRLGSDRGERAVILAGQAVRAVALGVVVTAFAQSLIGGIGLAVAGLPFAALLTALMFVLCLIQVGPGLVLFPAVVWLYYSGDVLDGTVLLVFSIVAVTVDQFIRPILIRRGADLPLLLILGGVIGGLVAFGILGIFIGPTVLAVAYTLVNAWIAEAGLGAEESPSADIGLG